MMVLTFFGFGLVSVASLGLAIPVPQFQAPWNGFFLPEQNCDTLGNRPYGPYAVQAPPRYPYGPQSYYGPLLPPSPPTPYVSGAGEKPICPPEEKQVGLPPNYGRPDYGPGYVPPPPIINCPPFRPYVSPPPARPESPPAKAVNEVIAEGGGQEQKPGLSLLERLTAVEGPADPAPESPPANEKVAAQLIKPASGNDEGSKEENSMRYHVNVGGIQKGAGGGTTNFHVYTDENGTKKFSDELDPETEKYITENMIPKLGSKRRKGGGVWSVFGN